MFLRKHIYIIFFLFSFMGTAHLMHTTPRGYVYHASANTGFSAGFYHSKKTFKNNPAAKSSLFYNVFNFNSERMQQIQSICGTECQNLLITVFNLINNFEGIFIVLFLLYVFRQMLTAFSIKHPPRFSSY